MEIKIIDCPCPVCGKPSAGIEDSEGTEPLECYNCTMKEAYEKRMDGTD